MKLLAYWGVKIYLTTGTGLWYADQDEIDLVTDKDKAKIFLTEGSAKRFITKLREKTPALEGVTVEAVILRELL